MRHDYYNVNIKLEIFDTLIEKKIIPMIIDKITNLSDNNRVPVDIIENIYNEIGYYKGLIDIVTDIEYWEHFNLDIDRYKRCKFFIEYLDLIVTYCKHNDCDIRLFKKLFLSRLLNWRKENVID